MVHPKPFRLLPLFLLFISCSENDPAPLDRSSLIAGNDPFGKTWTISNIEVELGTITPHQCVTDNFITYFPNGNYEINEGATKCDPTDLPAITGQWELTTSETKLVIQIGDSTQVWNIEALNENNHKISSQFAEGKRTYSLTKSS